MRFNDAWPVFAAILAHSEMNDVDLVVRVTVVSVALASAAMRLPLIELPNPLRPTSWAVEPVA